MTTLEEQRWLAWFKKTKPFHDQTYEQLQHFVFMCELLIGHKMEHDIAEKLVIECFYCYKEIKDRNLFNLLDMMECVVVKLFGSVYLTVFEDKYRNALNHFDVAKIIQIYRS